VGSPSGEIASTFPSGAEEDRDDRGGASLAPRAVVPWPMLVSRGAPAGRGLLTA